jgi:hypothetical protein
LLHRSKGEIAIPTLGFKNKMVRRTKNLAQLGRRGKEALLFEKRRKNFGQWSWHAVAG